ncbi:MAG: long-chain fatty acid--CoA ligase [Phototrophicales bacterium]|nr:MAG: long-chain fatty acid--CoA ligase [Phototrophicales bacterium]
MVTYAERPWLKHYDPNVPHSLKPYPEQPLYKFLQESAQRFPERPAVVMSAKLPLLGRRASTLTYRELDQLSDALAVGLINLGVQKGDPVAIVMPNIAQFVIAFYAILKAGGIVAATNPTYPADKMAYQIKDSGAKVAIVMSLFYNTLKSVQNQTNLEKIIVTNVKEYLPNMARILFTIAKEKKEGHAPQIDPNDVEFQQLLKQYAGQKPSVDVSGDDIAIFQYTGGTTGVSKAAMATHNALVANTLMCKAWLSGDGPDEEEVFLAAIPLFHVFGMVAVMSFAVCMGAKMVMVPNARDIVDVMENIDHFKPTIFMGVPALYNAINNHPDVAKYDLTSIRACISGSAPLPPSTKQKFEQLSGGLIAEGFGMSEAPTATHVNPLRGENRVGSIGLPLPDMDMKIVSLEDGETLMPVGEPGELCMSGPQIMRGYHGMPTETNNVLRKDADGKIWLYTGDIARMDEDGYFYIVDRKKDMALIGGFNVYPRAVEDVLSAHPKVLEVGVAAIPHPEKEGQEALKAWVVVKEGETLTAEELIEFASQKLARYEVPTRIEFVDSLPRSTVGKILRRELVRQELEKLEQNKG